MQFNRLVLVGFVATMLLSPVAARADYILEISISGSGLTSGFDVIYNATTSTTTVVTAPDASWSYGFSHLGNSINFFATDGSLLTANSATAITSSVNGSTVSLQSTQTSIANSSGASVTIDAKSSNVYNVLPATANAWLISALKSTQIIGGTENQGTYALSSIYTPNGGPTSTQSLGPFTGAFGNVSVTSGVPLNNPVTIVTDLKGTIADGQTGSASGTTTVTNTPEPASLAIWSLGLAGMGYAARRRKRAAV